MELDIARSAHGIITVRVVSRVLEQLQPEVMPPLALSINRNSEAIGRQIFFDFAKNWQERIPYVKLDFHIELR